MISSAPIPTYAATENRCLLIRSRPTSRAFRLAHTSEVGPLEGGACGSENRHTRGPQFEVQEEGGVSVPACMRVGVLSRNTLAHR